MVQALLITKDACTKSNSADEIITGIYILMSVVEFSQELVDFELRSIEQQGHIQLPPVVFASDRPLR